MAETSYRRFDVLHHPAIGGRGGGGLTFLIQNGLTFLVKKSTRKLFGRLFFEKRRFLKVKSRPRSGSRP